MGFDTHIIYIIFGIQIPNNDKERVFTLLNCKQIRPKQRKFIIPDTLYYFIDYGDYCYIYLSSISFGLGEDDGECKPTIIVSPTQEQVNLFNSFLTKLDINYPYNQFFLPY